MAARRRKLLLADDSPTIQKVVHLTFSDEGMEVTAVGTGAEALAEIERSRPDVVLADVHMPGVGGYELCERIKRDASLARIPVVLLVGAFEPFNEAEARRVGADEVLTKPFQSIRDLVGKVGSLFGGKSSDDTPAAEATPAARPRADETGDTRSAMTDARRESREAAPASAAAFDAPREAAPPEPFADMDFDDRMIEARPDEVFGRARASAAADAQADDIEDDSYEVSQETTRTGMTIQDEGRTDAPAAGSPFARAFDAPTAGFEAAARETNVAGRETNVEAGALSATSVSASAAEVGMAAGASGAGAGEPVLAARFASPAAADDALLDLGRIESSPSADEADDFVLDLDEDSSPSFTAASSSAHARVAEGSAAAPFTFDAGEESRETRGEAADTRADAAGAFAEAAHGAGVDETASLFEVTPSSEPASPFEAPPLFGATPELAESAETSDVRDEEPRAQSTAPAYDELVAEVSRYAEAGEAEGAATRDFIEPRVVPSQEPEHPAGAHAVQDLSVEGDIARPPLDAYAPTPAPAESAEAAQSAPARLDASQLPPEVIEQIARRVVEMLSEREVREIAWEVVPELAERLIKQRLDEIAQK
ncbi:MAG TPA: response regulator [Pyrinomonadaceae bacterium]|nr:response regulator [Pyrinomonadaceae bacterium]